MCITHVSATHVLHLYFYTYNTICIEGVAQLAMYWVIQRHTVRPDNIHTAHLHINLTKRMIKYFVPRVLKT